VEGKGLDAERGQGFASFLSLTCVFFLYQLAARRGGETRPVKKAGGARGMSSSSSKKAGGLKDIEDEEESEDGGVKEEETVADDEGVADGEEDEEGLDLDEDDGEDGKEEDCNVSRCSRWWWPWWRPEELEKPQ